MDLNGIANVISHYYSVLSQNFCILVFLKDKVRGIFASQIYNLEMTYKFDRIALQTKFKNNFIFFHLMT